MQHYRRTLTRLALIGTALGFTGLAEAQSTQPAVSDHKTWYLAEGATNEFFQEEILIANPNGVQANVSVSLQKSDGTEIVVPLAIPPTSRYTFRVNSVAGMENANASAVVTSDQDIMVERSMYWPGPARRGGHNAAGVASPAPIWYFAEGALGIFDTYILISNPNAAPSDVKLTYLRTDGTTTTQNLTVGAKSRHTVWVNFDVPDAGEFSTIVETTNGQNIIAERAMYWFGYEGGHDAVGATAPSATWSFAEGFTGSGFQTFVLLGNPSAASADVRLTALFDDGTAPLQLTRTLAPTSRMTIETNLIPELQNRAFAIHVESLNSVPIIAERAIYFDGFREGNSSFGLTADGPRWAFADGQEDRFDGITYETFYLIANSTSTEATVAATFFREDGTGFTRNIVVAPQSRYTLSGKSFPELSNQRFAALFDSTNTVPVTIERAVYWGATRYGGHGSPGTPWNGPRAEPPSPGSVTVTGISPANGGPGTVVTLTGTNFTRDTAVTFGNTGAQVIWVEAGTLLVSAPGGMDGGVTVNVSSRGTTVAAPSPFVYPAAPPPPPPPNRTPDPAPGQMLPVPDMGWVVSEVAGQYPGALRNSCQEHGGSWEFIDRVVDRLRTFDTRWGYNCKRGNCPDLSQDVVAYHAGAGPEVNGALQTRTIDIISGHCGSNPVPWWALHAYGTGPDAARWHNRFRF